jgi:predicted RNA-binding Zn-ribbon protein involved in translation (DUF1610 family)
MTGAAPRPTMPILLGEGSEMSCCGEPRGAPRHMSRRCPRCASARVSQRARTLSLVWYACNACGYVWQLG